MSTTLSEEISFIDRIADRFEQDLRAGRTPRIESYLHGVPEPRRASLFKELLRVEKDFLVDVRQLIDPTDYLRRFPEYATVVNDVFQQETGPHPDTAT
jgi:hypothetical protein